MRKLGAVSLQQSVAALPNNKANRRALESVADTVDGIGGTAYVLIARGIDQEMNDRLLRAHAKLLDAEYREFLDECRKFQAEIAKEIRIQKLTEAELAEEEESLDRLRRWLDRIAHRDHLGSEQGVQAELALKECELVLEDYAAAVLSRTEQS